MNDLGGVRLFNQLKLASVVESTASVCHLLYKSVFDLCEMALGGERERYRPSGRLCVDRNGMDPRFVRPSYIDMDCQVDTLASELG